MTGRDILRDGVAEAPASGTTQVAGSAAIGSPRRRSRREWGEFDRLALGRLALGRLALGRLALGLLALASSAPTGTAQTPLTGTLLRDIREEVDGSPGDYGSSPDLLLVEAGLAWFRADDGLHGAELWVTDGTTAGTRMVADIDPWGSSNPYAMLRVPNGPLVFSASIDTQGAPKLGTELWRTDGTASGTTLVKDIFPGFGSSWIARRVVFGGRIWFFANDGQAGYELWSTDGTTAGTQRFLDLLPGPQGAGGIYGSRLAVSGGLLYFNTNFPTAALWVTDGTLAGTRQLRTFPGEAGKDCLAELGDLNGMLLFDGWDGSQSSLWRSDGTVAGTVQVPSAPGPEWIVASGSTALYAANVPGVGIELWSTNGTGPGTALVTDLFPGPSSGVINRGIAFANGVVFEGDDSTGRAAWYSGGTAATTHPIATPGTGIGYGPYSFTVAIGHAWFRADTPSGNELVGWDGVAPPALVDLAAGPASSYATPLGELNGRLLLIVTDGSVGTEPFTSDGTVAGTTLLGDLYAAETKDSTPREFTRFRDLAVFLADDGVSGVEPWVTDGSPAGTSRLLDIRPGPTSSDPSSLLAARHGVVFRADDGVHGMEPWVTDGTPGGTRLVLDLHPGPSGSSPKLLGAIADRVLFAADDGVLGSEPWITDGTAAGTTPLGDLWPGAAGSSPSGLAVLGPIAYFAAATPSTGAELWRTDGTPSGTWLVIDLGAGTAGIDPLHLTPVGDQVLFFGHDPATGLELYRSDGTFAGSGLLLDIHPGAASSVSAAAPKTPAVLDGVMLFEADDGVAGAELWRSDGTAAGTYRLEDLTPGAAPSPISKLTIAGGFAYFAATDSATNATELMRTDGSVGGATPLGVEDPESAWAHSSQGRFWAVGSDERVLVVSHDLPTANHEFWMTDGTAAGTAPWTDIAPGQGDAHPVGGVRLRDKLLFRADDIQHGQELHVIPFVATGSWVAEPLGHGCGGATLAAGGAARLGQTLFAGLASAAPFVPAHLYVSSTSADIPVGSGCVLYLGSPLFLGQLTTDAAGAATFPLPVPNLPLLVGMPLRLQSVVLTTGPVPALGATTNALEVLVGP